VESWVAERVFLAVFPEVYATTERMGLIFQENWVFEVSKWQNAEN
jgi:hypothetical protein